MGLEAGTRVALISLDGGRLRWGHDNDGSWPEPAASKTTRKEADVKKLANKAEVVAGQVVQRVARAAFFGVVGLFMGAAQ